MFKLCVVRTLYIPLPVILTQLQPCFTSRQTYGLIMMYLGTYLMIFCGNNKPSFDMISVLEMFDKNQYVTGNRPFSFISFW